MNVVAAAVTLVALGCLIVGVWRVAHGKSFRPYDRPGDDS